MIPPGVSSRNARKLLRLVPSRLKLNLPSLKLSVLVDTLIALRLRRNPLLLDGQRAPLQVRVKPVNPLKG